MKAIPPYVLQDGSCYVLLEPDQYGRETANLKLIIGLARDKCDQLKERLARLDDESEEYDRLQEEMNDYEMLISDAEDRFELLVQIPGDVWT